jgi:uncharacterized protein YjeT (DUF2065 family)
VSQQSSTRSVLAHESLPRSRILDVSCAPIIGSATLTDTLFRDALTFRIWKTFQEAFPDVAELDHIYQVRVPGTMGTPPTEIPSITRQLTTLPFSTLTNLNVRNLLLRHVHLMDLTNFSNLAVLALEQFVECAAFPFHYDTGIDEQFMKRWGVIVQEKKAFMQLKVIVFRAFRISIPVTLNCFEKFSSLALCNTDYLVMEGLTNSFVPKTWRLMCVENLLHCPLPVIVANISLIGTG